MAWLGRGFDVRLSRGLPLAAPGPTASPCSAMPCWSGRSRGRTAMPSLRCIAGTHGKSVVWRAGSVQRTPTMSFRTSSFACGSTPNASTPIEARLGASCWQWSVAAPSTVRRSAAARRARESGQGSQPRGPEGLRRGSGGRPHRGDCAESAASPAPSTRMPCDHARLPARALLSAGRCVPPATGGHGQGPDPQRAGPVGDLAGRNPPGARREHGARRPHCRQRLDPPARWSRRRLANEVAYRKLDDPDRPLSGNKFHALGCAISSRLGGVLLAVHACDPRTATRQTEEVGVVAGRDAKPSAQAPASLRRDPAGR